MKALLLTMLVVFPSGFKVSDRIEHAGNRSSPLRRLIPDLTHARLGSGPVGIRLSFAGFKARNNYTERLANLHDVVAERLESALANSANLAWMNR